jgi:penicillin-binding protein 1A
MSTILVKILATALTLGQVTARPEAVKTAFDPAQDGPAVAQVLKDGCAHMRRAFDIEDINLDDLIATAMEDPGAVTGEVKVLQGVNLGELHLVYRQFCKGESVANSPVDLGAVIAYYNTAVADLPDHTKLKGLRLPGVSTILDGNGERFSEIYEPDHRRVWVPLADIPEHVQKAFIAAEDKRFHQHKGIDERGVIRAFVGNLAQPGRPQGGSTITQQVAKNLLVGDDVTYERKMREMIVASRLERTLTKLEILEIYLNSIYLGRASWGVEMAAQSYFGKPAKALTLEEGALLAGLTKGPNYYNPDRQPERAQERFAYVLSRLGEDGVIPADRMKQAFGARPQLIALERVRRDGGFHFVDYLDREAKTLGGVESLTAASYTVRSTVNPALQRATETALQEGLARYELNTGRMSFQGAEANLGEAIARIGAAAAGKPAWRQALENARLPLYDVRWPAAVITEKTKTKNGGEVIRVGLKDGRVLPLTAWSPAIRRALKPHDVVYVRVVEASAAKIKGKAGAPARAELRVRPTVQGAAVVLENKTGRILAMAGGFSYPLSQLNRATQAHRQPGSAFKPVVYLAALGRGLQPNTLVRDTPVTLPPVGRFSSRPQDHWTPKNYDGAAAGLLTLRRALENSKNLVTARLLDGAIDNDPERSLQRVCELAMEAQLYVECVQHYPFVLGAQPVRVIDLAAFYAAIANEGVRPSPYSVEMIEQGAQTVYARVEKPPVMIGSADRVAFYQMKTILQGVLQRGTANAIRRLAPFVAGKTGTSDNENDVWFAGFTNEVSIVVWVGHDNADKRRTLGRGQTGGKVAVPIFESIVEAAWTHHAPKTALSPPSVEAQRQLVAMPIDLRTGDQVAEGAPGAFTEHFRRGRFGQVADTQFRLVPREEAYAFHHPDPRGDGEAAGGWFDDVYRGLFAEAPRRRDPRAEAPAWRGPSWVRPWWEEEDERPRRRPRRVDPDYPWGYRIY